MDKYNLVTENLLDNDLEKNVINKYQKIFKNLYNQTSKKNISSDKGPYNDLIGNELNEISKCKDKLIKNNFKNDTSIQQEIHKLIVKNNGCSIYNNDNNNCRIAGCKYDINEMKCVEDINEIKKMVNNNIINDFK